MVSHRDLLKLGGATVAAEAKYTFERLTSVKGHAPDLGHDYGGRLMAAWLDR
jgi:hypothetical protein